MTMPQLPWASYEYEANIVPGDDSKLLVAAASVYVQLGWRVFPINPKGKNPLIANWQEQATRNMSKVREWGRMWPDANIGIAPTEDQLIVDFDGVDGAESLFRYVLDPDTRVLPQTPIARTKKGIHIWYDVKDSGVNLGNYVRILPGVEYRVKGGYVVAPPSIHEDGDGTTYKWIKGHGPATPLVKPPPLLLLPQSRIKLLVKAIKKVEEGAGRNETGHWLACQLRDMSIPMPDAEELIEYFCSIANMVTPGVGHAYERSEAIITLRGTYATVPRKAAGHENNQQDIPYTDIGNSERYVQEWGKDLRYTTGLGWLKWYETHWEPDEAFAQECSKSTAQNILRWAVTLGNEEARKTALGWGLKSSALQRVKAMETLATSDPRVHRLDKSLDSDFWVLNLANGTLDLRTGLLRPHNRDDLITKVIPISYDPTAVCPTWLSFLDRIMDHDESLISFLKRAVGYSMTPSVQEQCLFFLHGTGRNGKSTFTETITRLMGTYAYRISAELLMAGRIANPEAPSPVIAGMKGSRFVVASELEDGQRWAEAKVKDLTGGDTLTGRHLNREPVSFKPTHKLWIYGNHRPIVRGSTEGIWRRIRLLPFLVTIPENEDNLFLADQLIEELPGILNWALEGCIEWQRDGLGTPAPVREATQEYREDMDVVQQFIEEVCVVDEGAKTLVAQIFRAYESWCHSRGEKPQTSLRFGESLGQKGYPSIKRGGSMYRVGIKLLGDD